MEPYIIDELPRDIFIGNQGETGALILQFDVSAWLAEWPTGAFEATFQAPFSSAVQTLLPEQISVTDDILSIKVTRSMTKDSGRASLVIRLLENVGDEVEKRSAVTPLLIKPSHKTAIGEIPSVVEDWVNKANALLDEVAELAPDAEAAAEAATSAGESAEAAAASLAKLTTLDVSVNKLTEGANPTVSRTETETGISLVIGIPKGDTGATGATGAKGDKGNDGKPFNYRGDYNPDADPLYTKNDVVRFGGGSFVYINDVDSNEPTSSESHWQQIAEKGEQGNQGNQGVKGDTGAKIVSGEYVGTSLKFTLDDASHFTIPGAKSVPDTWLEFQAAVRDGTIDQYFSVGDQFNVLKGGANLVFDIVDIGSSTRNVTANGNAPTDPNYFANFPNAKPVTLLMHDVINGVMFDNSEANYQITTEIASGAKCNISLESNTVAAATYNFTAPSALVVGGRLRINSATQLQYYATPTSAPVNIAMVAGAADAEYISIAGSLSVQNHPQRVSYGSNKYTESAIRQFLNAGGDAGYFWTSKSDYDLAPSWHSTLAGFRNGLDPDLLAVIGETTREVELNTVTDGGGQAVISDRIFLVSRMEIYGDAETAGHKGVQFQAYVGLPDIDKIKYDTTALSTARYWWMRSPHTVYARIARYVNTSGALSNYTAVSGYGAAAACVIL